MIRWRYSLVSLFVFVMLATAAKAADGKKAVSAHSPVPQESVQNPKAQLEKRKKLRQAVSLPRISVIIGYGVNGRGNFVSPAEVIPEPKEIAEVERELKGDATDAERYIRLADLYVRLNQPDNGKQSRLKAAELFRKQLEQHPTDIEIQLRLADTLDDIENSEEAEALVRRIVKDHPTDWHAWLVLGGILHGKSWRAIKGHTHFCSAGPEVLMQSMREANPPPEKIAASQQYRREAVACFDRAVSLAPGEAEVYLRRGASHYSYGFLECGLRLYKGEKADFFEYATARDALPDLRRALELNHEEYKGIGFVACMETMGAAYDLVRQDSSAKQPKKPLDVLSQPARKRMLDYVARLEKGIQNPDKSKAAEAAEVLCYLQLLVFADYSAAEKSARRSIALNPKREAAWDILNGFLAAAEKYRESADVCRERLERKDSARNRLMAAKAYEYLDQLEKAEQLVREGLQHEPKDFMLRLAQADLLLMHGDDESLHEAGKLLSKLREEKLPNDGRENSWINYTFAGGIYRGLIGEREQAQKWLKAVQKRQSDYPGLEDALKALEE